MKLKCAKAAANLAFEEAADLRDYLMILRGVHKSA